MIITHPIILENLHVNKSGQISATQIYCNYKILLFHYIKHMYTVYTLLYYQWKGKMSQITLGEQFLFLFVVGVLRNKIFLPNIWTKKCIFCLEFAAAGKIVWNVTRKYMTLKKDKNIRGQFFIPKASTFIFKLIF